MTRKYAGTRLRGYMDPMATARRKPAALFAFPDHAGVGRRVARRLGLAYRKIAVRSFPDGESLVRVNPAPWKGPAVLLCGLHEPNRRIVECLLAAETLRSRGASSITLIAPYMGYMRQDVEFNPGEAVSQSIVGNLLGRYVDRFLTIDAHLHRTSQLDQVLGIPCENLSASGEIGRRVATLDEPVVVGPDAESAQWARAVADAAGCEWTVGTKTRFGDRRVRFDIEDPQRVRGHTAVLVDDIVSTGNTIIEAAKAIARHKPKAIHLYCVHGLFVEDAECRIRKAGVTAIASSNTIPHPTNDVDITGVITEALRRNR